MNKITYLALLLMLVLIAAPGALAQTPDDETPSNETVCDAESGAAHGLCNAYCEAMDCETDNPNASAVACDRVASKFTNLTDRMMPCERLCPCAAFELWDDYLASGNWDSCNTGPAGAWSDLFRLLSNDPGNPRAFSGLLRGEYRCGVYSGGPEFHNITISAEEEAACEAELQEAADAVGTICTPF